MLLCNAVVQEAEDGKTEISAIGPIVSMQSVHNASLKDIAEQVQTKLKKYISIEYSV
jgi:hypothetical protein